MTTRHHTPRTQGARSGRGTTTPEGGWSRQRLLVVLFGAAGAAVVLLASLGYTLAVALGAGGGDDADQQASETPDSGLEMHSGIAVGQQRRDEIAAAPMAQVAPAALNPTEERPTDLEATTIAIPGGVVAGPAAVLTGFPHTPEGAVGQLVAIESTVLQLMSLATAEEVYQAWALPGGAGPNAWGLTTNVRAFLSGAEMSEVKDPATIVTIEPAAAMVKGTDGADWTLACALVTLTASLEQEVQIGLGHCERMQWVGGRWMIAPGVPPVDAPSTWPGSPAAADAGWSTWVTDTDTDTASGDLSGSGDF